MQFGSQFVHPHSLLSCFSNQLAFPSDFPYSSSHIVTAWYHHKYDPQLGLRAYQAAAVTQGWINVFTASKPSRQALVFLSRPFEREVLATERAQNQA